MLWKELKLPPKGSYINDVMVFDRRSQLVYEECSHGAEKYKEGRAGTIEKLYFNMRDVIYGLPLFQLMDQHGLRN